MTKNTRLKDFCRRGHPMVPDNLYVSPKGVRRCRACSKLSQKAHYNRGKGVEGRGPHPVPDAKKIADFWSRVDRTDSCWLWTGASHPDGYGVVRTCRAPYAWRIQAHRFAWWVTKGSLPEAPLVLDHICRVRACVNPDHLRVLTIGENTLAGIGASATNARKTHCIHGHEFTPENTIVGTGRSSRRTCRTCHNRISKMTKARARARAKAAA